MIQDILPYRLNNTFQNAAPVSTDFFFSFQGEKVLLKIRKGGGCALPTFQDLQRSISEVSDWIVYLFSVDGVSIYLILQQDTVMLDGKCLHYASIQSLSSVFPEWAYFAGITALHLGRWYERNVYCGKCGDMMEKDSKQRVLFCRKCGNMVYPAIAPLRKRVSALRICNILEASHGDFLIPLLWVILPNWTDRIKFILIPRNWQWQHGIPVLIYQKN